MEVQDAQTKKPQRYKLPPLEVRMKNLRPRHKGTPNKTTRVLKDAILFAAAAVGRDGKGKEALEGFLIAQASKPDNSPFMSLLGKVLPLTIAGDKNNPLVHNVRITLVRAEGAAKPEPRVINAKPVEAKR